MTDDGKVVNLVNLYCLLKFVEGFLPTLLFHKHSDYNHLYTYIEPEIC